MLDILLLFWRFTVTRMKKAPLLTIYDHTFKKKYNITEVPPDLIRDTQWSDYILWSGPPEVKAIAHLFFSYIAELQNEIEFLDSRIKDLNTRIKEMNS